MTTIFIHLEEFPIFILRLVIAIEMVAGVFCAMECFKLLDQIQLVYILLHKEVFPKYKKNICIFYCGVGLITHYLKKLPTFERKRQVALCPILQWCTVRRFKPLQDKIVTLTQWLT